MILDQVIAAASPKVVRRVWIVSDLQQRYPDRATHCMTRAADDFVSLGLHCDAVCYLGDAVEGGNIEFLMDMSRMQQEQFARVDAPVYYVLCSRRLDSVSIDLAPPDEHQASYLTLQMPIGGFSLAEDIQPTCGIAGESGFIGDVDSPLSFYVPERFGAQLIWFRSGFLEYRFSVPLMTNLIPEWIEVSFEACSEAPMYRDPWKSDITLKINGMKIGMWCCPCDCGGRRGALTPEWWSELSTQFGFPKTWRVDETGSYLEKERMSDTKLSELRLQEAPFFSIRIDVEKDAANVGGINLFGEHFGDYTQPLVVRIGYHIA